jgi:hypothetical protein
LRLKEAHHAVEPLRDLSRAEHVGTRGGQLDRERDPLERPAYASDRRGG